MANDVRVAIVGGGFAGISTAYHLATCGIESLVIEAGRVAEGNDEFPSGTQSIMKPNFSKWITHAFDSNYDTFSKIHGSENSRTFLELMQEGTEMIRQLAKANSPGIIRELGSLVIAEDEEQWQSLQGEHESYKRLGFGHDFERLERVQVNERLGLETRFVGGLFVPRGAMLNQREYIRMLVEISGDSLTLGEHTKVIRIEENKQGVRLKTNHGETITADNVVIATNGFNEDENLRGLLRPSFTFIRGYEAPGKNTPGCWTFGKDYFYITRQDNILLVGGLDTPMNVNGPFKIDETPAMNTLQRWAQENFASANIKNLTSMYFGVYTRTKDELPIVGRFQEGSRRAYIVGCNAIGHTTYNVAASLMPAILGYADVKPEQRKFVELLSPRRNSL
jgi:glycine/D-amino acid oxidase-like deaminating enzyme